MCSILLLFAILPPFFIPLMAVILPFIIMHWPSFMVMVVPSFILQVPSVMHTLPSLMVMFSVMGIILPPFIVIILPSFMVQLFVAIMLVWLILPECILPLPILPPSWAWAREVASSSTAATRSWGAETRNLRIRMGWEKVEKVVLLG